MFNLAHAVYSDVRDFVYDKTIGTLQVLNLKDDIPGLGLLKMAGKAMAAAFAVGLVSSAISISPTIPMIVGGLSTFSYLVKAYDLDQWFDDSRQQNVYIESYPFLGKIFANPFNTIN